MIENIKSYLGQTVEVKMDRPLGTAHPKHGWKYEANYGFIPGTKNADGEELDAYVLGVNEPLETFKGTCIAIIHRLNDDDDKLVVVPETAVGMTDEEIRTATHFQEQFFKSEILRAETEERAAA
jgi:inorganic pyrophosphatase